MKTTLHHYRFDDRDAAQKAAYLDMVRRIEADGPEARGHRLHAIGTKHTDDRTDSEEVELDPSCLLENQWNEAGDGSRRLFDWYEEAVYVNGREIKNIHRGHWLEITAEMYAARRDTVKCGYCGQHYGPFHSPAPGEFCAACLDSPYLKAEELHLLRLLPLVGPQTRDRLTDDERAELLPLYVARQTTGHDSRAKAKRDKQRADVLKKYADETAAATEERDGMLWIWDHGFGLENVIYYSHTKKFSFGWRSPVSPEVESALLDVLSEFPHEYEIKCAGGRVLSAIE